jgi:uncharacterized lipoprotein YddW (UPF0748 family)
MNHKRLGTALTLVWLAVNPVVAAPNYIPTTTEPPAIQREMRAAWVATVENIDWPSKPGLTTAQQQTELIALLDRAVKLRLNAVILQVRPACDAIYASKIEPWSYYLTGAMGKAPEPYYDPLTFAVAEAHKRGLELHAWFNPFRAALLNSKGTLSRNHISHVHPEMVVKYGKFLWLDPGDRAVQKYSLNVVMDVVKRYDIDGVHFDDYFYPYKEQDAHGKDMDFPDWQSWKRYGLGGKLSRDDWRRQNVNTFVQKIYDAIKSTKPWVKFGVAPFGIWQPGYPAQIKGFNAYNVLYCDSRKWLENGWLDYCSPQLYWSIDSPEQSFPMLLKWWTEQNPKHRNIWPGVNADRVGGKWKADEIVNQVKLTRNLLGAGAGTVYWSMKSLLQDNGGLDEALTNHVYDEPALIPASPWLDAKFLLKPKLKIGERGDLEWKPALYDRISLWLLQTKENGHWRTRIFPGNETGTVINGSPDIIALTAIDRCGVASPAVVMQPAPAGAK